MYDRIKNSVNIQTCVPLVGECSVLLDKFTYSENFLANKEWLSEQYSQDLLYKKIAQFLGVLNLTLKKRNLSKIKYVTVFRNSANSGKLGRADIDLSIPSDTGLKEKVKENFGEMFLNTITSIVTKEKDKKDQDQKPEDKNEGGREWTTAIPS